jgi:hypothetical protein
MTKNETIARLARRVERQRQQLKYHRGAVTRIHMQIYGCGGPLNDNVDGFSREQMKVFLRIAEELRRIHQ